MKDVVFLPSVLVTGQVPSRIQRRGRYVGESMRHPGKMLPSIASHVIDALTQPGDLVVDPMCGIGTTLVEAVHLGCNAVGMEYESDFAQLTALNLLHAHSQGAKGWGKVVCGDARNIATTHSSFRGQAALVLTSPPYGSYTHGHVSSGARDGDGGPVRKRNHRYSTDRGNLAHAPLPELLNGFEQILRGCLGLLRPDGIIAVTVRPIRQKGELIDLPGQVITAAQRAGLVLAGRFVALLCGLRDGQLVNRSSFFQVLEARRAREKGVPVCAIAHEDLLIFTRPSTAEEDS